MALANMNNGLIQWQQSAIEYSLPLYFSDCTGWHFLHAQQIENHHRLLQYLQHNHTNKQDSRWLPDTNSLDSTAPWGNKEQIRQPSVGLPSACWGAHTALGLLMVSVEALGQGHKDGWTHKFIQGESWESYAYQRNAESHKKIKVRRSSWRHLRNFPFKRKTKLSHSQPPFH